MGFAVMEEGKLACGGYLGTFLGGKVVVGVAGFDETASCCNGAVLVVWPREFIPNLVAEIRVFWISAFFWTQMNVQVGHIFGAEHFEKAKCGFTIHPWVEIVHSLPA